MDNKKFTIEVNKATYLIVTLLFLVLFVKNKNNAPVEGNKISEERIGKFIILQLRRLKMQKNQATLQMRTDKYNHFEIY